MTDEIFNVMKHFDRSYINQCGELIISDRGNVTKYYLVQGEYGDMFVACYYNDGWQQIFHYDYKIKDKIVAWMELPKRFIPKEKFLWEYDVERHNWVCPKCGEPLPKTYVCDEDFMREHFRFCNHCGEQLVGDVE